MGRKQKQLRRGTKFEQRIEDHIVHDASKEIIWHFTRGTCSNWWSYATSDSYEPKTMTCPHCGSTGYINEDN